VEAFAASGLEPAFEANGLERRSHELRRRHHQTPRHFRAGIEVEDKAIRPLETVRGGVPGVEFDDVALGERDERRLVVHDHVVADLGLLLNLHDADMGRRALA
jgi:hypothetical protein